MGKSLGGVGTTLGLKNFLNFECLQFKFHIGKLGEIMRKILYVFCLTLFGTGLFLAQPSNAQTPTDETTGEQEMTPEQQAELEAYLKEGEEYMATLSPKTGSVKIPTAGATLELGEDYYFLGPKDARDILENKWGNPPDKSVLGMILAKDTTPYVYDYVVVLTFDRSGYVSDKDARKINFDKMLKQMQKAAKAANPERIKQGYGSVELLGWADAPKYDDVNKRLSWAKSLRFAGDDTKTLNYNLRFLGRRGVLEFNYIADEDALDVIKQAMPVMSQMASYDAGHRYSDFNESTDKVAAYGVAGLIAGGIIAKKAGLIGLLLIFLKKGWILLLIGFAAMRNFFSRLFGLSGRDEGQ